jgi:adenylate cyclase
MKLTQPQKRQRNWRKFVDRFTDRPTPRSRKSRFIVFQSIQTRIITAITVLILMVVTAMVWLWATNEMDFYRTQKIQQAASFAAFGQGFQGELTDKNWANMRIKMNLLLQGNEDFVYVMVDDISEKHQIVAAAPTELAGNFMTDVVPVTVSKQAVHFGQTNISKSDKARISETYLLRDIEFPTGTLRAQRGERIIEAAFDIPNSDNLVSGTFRIGITLRRMDRQITNAVSKTLIVGAIALILGMLAAYYLAWHLSQPILQLRQSASRIAAGDLDHRVRIHSQDELGALAQSFNEMSDSLQASFGQIQKTLESFERFVPDKFLQVIAPRGIENITVGEYAKRHMTILFSDIRGYTTLSESQSPEATFHFLNEYIAYVGGAIDQHGGFIDKYIGDAVMAIFDESHTDGALKAAIAMQTAIQQFNHQRQQQGLPAIASGIGIHQGEVVMGTVGFAARMDSTVIGDAVNVSSRIEGLTKHYNCEILITRNVIDALARPQDFHLELMEAAVKVKGKATAIDLYRVHLTGYLCGHIE